MPPKKPGDHAHRAADQHRHERRGEPDLERHAGAGDQQREHVDAAVVGAEPVRRSWAARRPGRSSSWIGTAPARREDRDEHEEEQDAEPDQRRRLAEDRRRARSPACGARRGPRRTAPRAVPAQLGSGWSIAHVVTRGSSLKYSRSARKLNRITEIVSSRKIALQQRVVAFVDRIDGRQADARVGEHVLDGDRAADDEPERQRDQRDDRQHRVAQAVLAHDRPVAEALGARRQHVVLAQRLEHRRAHDQRVLAVEHESRASAPAGSCARAGPSSSRTSEGVAQDAEVGLWMPPCGSPIRSATK